MARASKQTAPVRRHVALLRGINVGGRNRVAMKDLVSVFDETGCEAVETYIQSGNVVFEASDALALRVPRLVTDALSTRFGLDVPVVIRSAHDLRRLVSTNPFVAAGAAEDSLHVVFLADAPSPTKLATLDPARSPPDRFEVRGRDIYLHCPNGFARTKLTNAWFDARLGTVSTVRNWKTVQKLLTLVEGA